MIQNLKLDKDKNIHLGLVMAGAVTAGAYTAGVLDYLIHTLKLWEEAYEDNPSLPKPNVKLDTFTGASAGSIAAAVAALALATGRTKPVENPYTHKSIDNLLFYTWVNLGLDSHELMWQRLLKTDDLEEEGLKSLLNTSFINDLIEKIILQTKPEDILDKLPNFVNQDMEVLMTLSNLRGVPINLYFTDAKNDAAHRMVYHKAFAHFIYNRPTFDSNDPSRLPLDFTNKQLLTDFLGAARASGAFPIGLKSSTLKNISKEYINQSLKEVFGDINMNADLPDEYNIIAVDGGMTNNEPIAEALRIMKKRHEDPLLILIDPFPNYLKEKKEAEFDTEKNSVFEIVPMLISTLRNQVLFKESDIKELFNDEVRKNMIWPTRYVKNDDQGYDKKMNAIACGALDGFAGFLSRDFRVHDFMLGQKNCQNFLRYYFHLPEEKHPFIEQWTPELKEKYAIKDKEGNWKLPIVPDFRITGHKIEKSAKKFLPKLEEQANFPAFPTINYHDTFLGRDGLEHQLKKRVENIIEPIVFQMLAPKQQDENAHPWVKERQSKKGYLLNLDGAFIKALGVIDIDLGAKDAVSDLVGKITSKKITNELMKVIIETLSKWELFENDPARK